MEYQHSLSLINSKFKDILQSDRYSWREIDIQNMNENDLDRLYEEYLISINRFYNYSIPEYKKELLSKIPYSKNNVDNVLQRIAAEDDIKAVIKETAEALIDYKDKNDIFRIKSNLLSIIENKINVIISSAQDGDAINEFESLIKLLEDSQLAGKEIILKKVKPTFNLLKQYKGIHNKLEEIEEQNTIDEIKMNNIIKEKEETRKKLYEEMIKNKEIKEAKELQEEREDEITKLLRQFIGELVIPKDWVKILREIFKLFRYDKPEKINRKYLENICSKIAMIFEMIIKETYLNGFYREYPDYKKYNYNTDTISKKSLVEISKGNNISIESFYYLINEDLELKEASDNKHILYYLKKYLLKDISNSLFIKSLRNVKYKTKEYLSIKYVVQLRNDEVHKNTGNKKYQRDERCFNRDLNDIFSFFLNNFKFSDGLFFLAVKDYNELSSDKAEYDDGAETGDPE